MPTKQEYKQIIEEKLSAESDKNQEKAGVGTSGSKGADSGISAKD